MLRKVRTDFREALAGAAAGKFRPGRALRTRPASRRREEIGNCYTKRLGVQRPLP
jgi:hypothetical protein